MERAASRKRALGALAAGALALALFGCFYGWGVIGHLATNFFSASSEDLLKDYYTTAYHVAYDDNLLQCRAMNYPYGEYHTYSGLQDQVAWPLLALKKLGVQHAERATALLINAYIVLSVCLAAAFLFLVLRWLSLPSWLAMAGALLITFLMPQLQRMGGHMSLSYGCVIPMALFFLLRHYDTHRWSWALAFGATALLAGLAHVYYMVFFVALGTGYLAWTLFRMGKDGWHGCQWCVALLLQMVLPLAAFFILTHVGDSATERSAVPWGFHANRGRVEGLLFPYHSWHPSFVADIEWEARCYLGIVAIAVLAALSAGGLVLLFRKRGNCPRPNREQRILLLFLLVAVVLAGYACLAPTLLPDNFVAYIGPLAQIRAVCRLSWLLFFVANVVALYALWRWCGKGRGKKRYAVLALALAVFAAEDVAYNKGAASWARNERPAFTDYDNLLPEDEWATQLDAARYQAVLTLPAFNKGSEAFCVEIQDGMFERSALLSLKTGLPLLSQASARSDMRQAWESLQMALLPWRDYSLLSTARDERPLLIVCTPHQELLNENEQRLLDKARPLGISVMGAPLLSISLNDLRAACHEAQDSLRQRYRLAAPAECHHANGVIHTANIHAANVLYDGIPLRADSAQTVEVSFWMEPFLCDQYAQSMLLIRYADSLGAERQVYNDYVFRKAVTFDDSTRRALIATAFDLPAGYRSLHVEICNPTMRPREASFYNLLIRPAHSNVAQGGRLNNIPIM